jgi:FAD/FMN-containing dehydrogenase
MNSTTYHPDNNTATILPGSRWLQVYETLDALNVTVPGGRAGTVGVAGLINGGGNSFYAARKGMVCDNVLEFEIVLANGTIVYATNTTNSDLFKAQKGGGSNVRIEGENT